MKKQEMKKQEMKRGCLVVGGFGLVLALVY